MKNAKVIDLINETQDKFKKADIETFELDAKILIAHLLGLSDPEQIVFELNKKVSQEAYDKFISLVKRRLNFEPIAYIIGYKHFWKQVYKINENVLIPRPETELIVELILEKLQDRKNEKLCILDLGTGSGCIILSLLSELKNSFGIGVDISDKALDVAKSNANNLQLTERIEFVKSNWFDALKKETKFDIIVSNPPYIAKNVWQNLPANVKNFEPSIALTNGRDGLKSYKIIAHCAKFFLKKDGIIVVEIGYNQKELVKNIFETQGYAIKFYKDLEGIYRVSVIIHAE